MEAGRVTADAGILHLVPVQQNGTPRENQDQGWAVDLKARFPSLSTDPSGLTSYVVQNFSPNSKPAEDYCSNM